MKQRQTLWTGVLCGQRLRFILAMGCVALTALLTFFPQQVLRFTIDNVIGGAPTQLPAWADALVQWAGGIEGLRGKLWLCALAMMTVAAVNGLFTGLRSRLAVSASERSVKKLREQLYDHMQRLPYAALKNSGTGDLLQRCTSDVDTIRRFLSVQVIEITRAVCLIVFALCIMLPMSTTMTFVSLGCVPFLIVFSFVYFKSVRTHFQRAEEADGAMSVVLQENLTGVRVVRAFGQQAAEVEKFDHKSVRYRTLCRKLNKLLSYYWAGSDLMIYVQIALSTLVGVLLVQKGSLSIGTLITFISYTSTLLWPIRQMGRVLADLGKTLVALERIGEILHVPVESDPSDAKAPPVAGDIVFENVCFAYEDGGEVLHDISFHAKAGQTIGILGATGSGKSSLVMLLQRLYEPTRGQIYLDGTPLHEIERHHLRRHVGIVLQEPFLYSRTIHENIAITRTGASRQEVLESARIASIDELETEFDEGFDTLVGERGVTLSGGQKQRIAIARMLMQHTPVMIFDDSLSALDTQTDAAIRLALKARRQGTTTLIISHRINTLMDADQILVLDQGRIVQQGTHAQLLQRPGLYRDTVALQGGLLGQGGDEQ